MADIMLKSLKFPGLDDKYLIPQIDNTLTQNGKAADAKKTGDRLTPLETAIVTKANQDGYYSDMTAGNAEQLVASIGEEDKVPYNFRTAGGAIDIGDRLTEKIVGGTVAWNQKIGIGVSDKSTTVSSVTITDNRDGSYTFNGTASAASSYAVAVEVSMPINHIFYMYGCANGGSASTYYLGVAGLKVDFGNGGLWKNTTTYTSLTVRIDFHSGDVFSNHVFKPIFIDLTQMFGSTIADYIYSLEQANAGAGVAWFRKLFPKPYYPYNAGELMSVKTSAHKMTGFNQFDVTNLQQAGTANVRTVDNIPVVAGQSYELNWETLDFTGGGVYLYEYDSAGTEIKTNVVYNSQYHSLSVTLQSNTVSVGLNVYKSGITVNAVAAANLCLHLRWDNSRDGEYEPYEENVYPLDSDLELRGIPKLDSGNNLYYDGDTYASDGTVTRRYGIVDLGTLTWTKYTSSVDFFVAHCSGIKLATGMMNPKYIQTTFAPNNSNMPDKSVYNYAWFSYSDNVIVRDDSYADAAAFKTAMSGVYLVYELATPTTESADPYQNPQIVDDFGTEEYVDERTVAIPVGHESFYAANLKAKLEMAPDSPDGNGDYIVRQTNGVNEYVPLVIPDELPTQPTTNGNYILKCAVVNGTPTLSWESAN